MSNYWGKKKAKREYGNKYCHVHPETLELVKEIEFFDSRAGRESRAKYKEEMIEKGYIRFQSIAEAKRYQHLREWENVGDIENLDYQVSYELYSRTGKYLRLYTPDFVYRWNGQVVAEDVKGQPTELYRANRKHFIADYPDILFFEVPAKQVWMPPRILEATGGKR